MKKAQLLPSTVQKVGPQQSQSTQPTPAGAQPPAATTQCTYSEMIDAYYMDQNSWLNSHPGKSPADYKKCQQSNRQRNSPNWLARMKSQPMNLVNQLKNRIRDVR